VAPNPLRAYGWPLLTGGTILLWLAYLELTPLEPQFLLLGALLVAPIGEEVFKLAFYRGLVGFVVRWRPAQLTPFLIAAYWGWFEQHGLPGDILETKLWRIQFHLALALLAYTQGFRWRSLRWLPLLHGLHNLYAHYTSPFWLSRLDAAVWFLALMWLADLAFTERWRHLKRGGHIPLRLRLAALTLALKLKGSPRAFLMAVLGPDRPLPL
jgi:hypothetical protein